LGEPAPQAVSLRGVTKRFPGVLANDHVDFDAAWGEVHALLGENGAGKSTLSNIITGLYRPDDGEMAIDGRHVQFRHPREALEAGIFMVHQHFRLVPTFTVAENVILGDTRGEGRHFRVHPERIQGHVADLAERYGLAVHPGARVWQLSVGEQQRVEILKALYREARILILDEPTAVLTPQEADALFGTLRRMAAEGRTVIFISHKLHEVSAVSDRVTVMRAGQVVATAATASVTPREMAALMVGREVTPERHEGPARPPGDPVLEVASVSASGDRGTAALTDVSFELRAGEILAIAGVAGNGQRELAEAITGLRPRSGTVRVGGRVLAPSDSRAAIAAGMSHVPEDRMHTGVAPSLSIAANVILKRYRSRDLSRGPFLRRGRTRQMATDLIRDYDVRAPGPDAPVRLLSGGNLQKIVLGREFASDPRVLIAAAPTRGLDVGAIETVHAYLRDAAARGVGVLVISEDLDEILVLADRIAVMYEGRIAGVVEADGANPEELGLLMAGAGTAAE
jgi:general nucleoside transport system ATP-binding protein